MAGDRLGQQAGAATRLGRKGGEGAGERRAEGHAGERGGGWVFPAMAGEDGGGRRAPTSPKAVATLTCVSETVDVTILYEDGDDGWIVASVPAVPGAMSQGRTREEARENVLDALALMLSPDPGEKRERELLHLKVA